MKKTLFVSIIIFAVAAVGLYGAYTFYQINNPKTLFQDDLPLNDKQDKKDDVVLLNPNTSDENHDTGSAQEPAPQPEETYKFTEDRINILLLGLDASKERYGTMKSFRTDTIMLASIDFSNRKVYIMSIPRDSYVEIPGRKEREKINAAFIRGGGFKGEGFQKTMETVSHLLGGIPINYYMAVDMNVVKEVIDIMGGVNYNVDIDVEICGRTLEKGLQLLNGQQVLDYVRTRHTGKGDIDRIGRQQKIVLAIFKQLKSTKQLVKVPEIYNTVKENVYTNMNLKQIAALALFGTKIEHEDIYTYTIPGGFVNLDGISYWGVDQYKKRDMVKEVFGVTIEVGAEDDIKYLRKIAAERRKVVVDSIHYGQSAINAGNGTLVTYGHVLKDEEKTNLENGIKSIKRAIDAVEHIVDDREVEKVKKAADQLLKYNAAVVPLAVERDKAVKAAQSLIQEVTGKIGQYNVYFEGNEKSELEAKVQQLKQSITTREAQTIRGAAEELKECADRIFKACEDRKKTTPVQEESEQELFFY